MAEATVNHVLATVTRVAELAEAHDLEHRHAAIAIHRDTLPELAAAARDAHREPAPASPPTMPATGRR